ncbi:MAG: MBL fold metallo-hydrolase [Erysipelotrichaceae bacterium]|nr:MBL fold metallo-hydrolase [Erysipelotrichaceae bacterium]
MKELKKLSERLYVYEYEEYGDRPNLFYIKGDDFSAAVDAGNSRKHLEAFYKAIEDKGFPLPLYTIISHWHWDHTFALNAINGYSIASSKCQEYLDKVMKWEWNLEAMKKREISGEDIAFCNENIQLEYPDLKEISVINTDIGISEEMDMDLGGIIVKLIPMASTHGYDSLYVYLPSEDALIVEDADNPDFYHGSIYDQDVLKKMISFFESLDYKYHYLGHAECETKEEAIERLRKEII